MLAHAIEPKKQGLPTGHLPIPGAGAGFETPPHMLERLTGADSIRNAERRLRTLINAHAEWLYSRDTAKAALLLRNSECDFQARHGRLKFSCWGEEGALVWRITAWEWTGERLLLEGS